ncbi:EAL domain-containing protein [Rhodoferax sp.]|uniref:EAL domain-containing protein n=1 Tax=Rhodoferax sp. TaxID=50421 RepID=UPI0025F587AC|nr:EAL domain-containing protein [Rhodoferax sp.]MCM2297215.1 EAL domain-containing protein [Rhodoferax sp.]
MKTNHPSDNSNIGAVETLRLPVAENRYRTLFEHSPDGILIADPNSYYIDANPSMCRMLGYVRDELIGLHASDIVAQDEIQHIGPALDDIKAGFNYCREWQFRRKNGSTFGAEVFATTLPEGNLLAMVRDISDRKQAQSVSTWLAAIVESSQDAIIGKDLNSTVVNWNIGAEMIFGYSAEEMVGTSVLRLIPADRQDEEAWILAKIKRGEKVDHFETLRKTKDGRLVDVMITISPVRDATGKIIGASKIARDFTVLKEHEREIERISSLYAALSQINKAIVTTRSRDVLFRKICGVLVEHGGFRMAWIGWHDPETQLLVPVAECGDESGYRCSVKVYVDDRPEGRGPGGMAFRNEQPYISNDMANDPSMLPWRDEFMPRGFRALAVFPMRLKGVVCGTISVYASESGFFRDKEIALLEEAASNISFALDNLARDEERLHAAREIKFKNTILQTQQETSLDGILVIGENDQIISYNHQFIDLWRLSPQLVSAGKDTPVLKSVLDQTENPEAFLARVKYLFEHRDERSLEEVPLKDGRVIERYSSPAVGADGKYYGRIWYFRDITERKRAKVALETSEQEQRALAGLLEIERSRLLAAQRIAKVGSWESYPSTGAVVWSAETHRIFETDPRQLKPTHQAFLERVHPEDREAVAKAFTNSLGQPAPGSPSPCSIEHRLLTPDGRIKFVEENWQVLFDDQGQAEKAIGTCQDITERQTAQARISYLNRVHAMLSGISTLIVHVQDRDELFRGACRIAVETGGFSMALLVILDPAMKQVISVVSEGKDAELKANIHELLSRGMDVSNTMVATAIREKSAIVSNDSQNDPRVLLGKKYTDAGVRSLMILPLMIEQEAVGAFALYSTQIDFFHADEIRLLTELAGDIAFAVNHLDKQERLNFLAYHDELTGLANRTLFLDRVSQFMSRAKRAGHQLALLMIDLERFKNINDSLGRQAGDALLKQVAQWLARHFDGEHLVARLETDHFAVVLPEIRQDGELSKLFDKMSEALLLHTFQLNDMHALRIAAKVGIAIYPDDGTDVDVLFRNAEAALKLAKKSGSRYLFHTKKMTEAVAGKLALENQLRQAIDNGEFVLHYQPKVNLASGKVSSAEALIRWNDPRTGLVPPGQFIPILEETGLIYEVGRWALRQAIADSLRWRSAGWPAVRIAVNVSPLQLRNPGFIAEIERKITVDPHAAEGLELEITESLVMEDVERNIAILQAVRAMGISIAIDDFGTGFSSLSYLAKLPVTTLKIDRSFIIEMTVGPEGLALVSTIIKLAHAFKLKVVAEGVETEEQSRLLTLLGCDEIQGFLFCKAVPCEEFEARFLSPN